MVMHCILVAFVALFPATLLAQRAAGAPVPDYEQADSVFLHRTPGYFGGPSYRIIITRVGEVRYVRGPSSPSAPATTIDRPGFNVLMAHAAGAAFVALPDTIMSNRTFCSILHTDAPTVIVELYLPGSTKRVVDYLGCRWAPAALREFETAIERAAGVNVHGRPG
jgi:hypothetical protein